MSRNTFDKLLDKYLAGKCTNEEKQLVEQWYTLLDGQDVDNQWNREEIKNKIWTKINNTLKPPTRILAIRRYTILRYAAAAIVIMLISIGLNFYLKNINQDKTEIAFSAEAPHLKQKNTSDKMLSLTLEDGSVVALYPDAEVVYPKQFANDKREVELRGEAFFQVAKNPLKPFLVHANGTVTKVLGTSFNIRAFENEKTVTVSVRTGKVSVYATKPPANKRNSQADPETQGVVLTPNQKVIFDLKTSQIQKTVAEKPELLIPLSKTEDFIFDDAPIVNIFEAMEKAYGIDIVYDEDVLKNCSLTTNLTDEPMFKKMKIICAAIGGTYKEIDAQIVITAKGCQ